MPLVPRPENNDTMAFLSVSVCLFFILRIFAQRSGGDGARARWGWWWAYDKTMLTFLQ